MGDCTQVFPEPSPIKGAASARRNTRSGSGSLVLGDLMTIPDTSKLSGESGTSPERRHGSIAREALVKMAWRIAVVIVATTTFSYFHIVSN
ncbi:MAG: hypothetical protein ACI8X5_003126, partial [Planctomycetota bacterium]